LDELSMQAAIAITGQINKTVAEKGTCSVILAGGNTPRKCYTQVAASLAAMPAQYPEFLSRIHWFAGDERHVAKNDAARNEKMFKTELFDIMDTPLENLHFWDCPPTSPEESGRRYDELLKSFFTGNTSAPDIVLLGLGADGHTASLFPGSMAVYSNGQKHRLSPEEKPRAFAVYRPDADIYRLSMSAEFLKTGKHIMMLVAGEDKKWAFSRLEAGDAAIPATWVLCPAIECWITSDVVR
ncbi:MAG: 6-phosphogluconolactonase, partial [Spirochaetaceae bacterium]